MAHAQPVIVLELEQEVKLLLAKSAIHIRPRLKMLLYLSKGIYAIDALAAKTGVSRNSVARWKRLYKSGGITALCADERGGDFISGIDQAAKNKIEAKLSDPKAAFTSYKQAQAWMAEEMGLDKKYHAVNKYLKRNFGVKLKVGRKSHIKKDEAAVAVFKKT